MGDLPSNDPLAGSLKVDLHAPFTSDVILEVRTGSMKPMPGLTVLSGIDKTLREGPVRVTELGLESDEHDPTFHGGRDKAIHGCESHVILLSEKQKKESGTDGRTDCSSHYATWRAEFPEAADAFKPGGFGENLVTAHLNERNLCIGDIVSISRPGRTTTSSSHTAQPADGDTADDGDDAVLLQVSLPRQPCFKLNHRFRLKNFAPLTWKTSRTGWYFRVLRPGVIRAGDVIRLVERPHPRWTIERVQEYLHRNTTDAAANEELAAIPEFGAECADIFRARVARQKARERRLQREREAGGKKKEIWREYRIVEKTRETPRVMTFTLEAVLPTPSTDGDEVEVRPGSHAKLRLPNGLVRAYSIVSSNSDGSRLQLGVGLAENSRGGSAYLHHTSQVGDILHIGAITPPPETSRTRAKAASHHVFLVGGIGITAFLALLERYRDIHYSAALHYAVRNEEVDVPFRERLAALTRRTNSGENSSVTVTIYDASTGNRLSVPEILASFPWNARLYVCGPRRLMDEALREAQARGIPPQDIHFEAFSADEVDDDVTKDPFEAVVANRGGKVVRVGSDETLLEALRREFGEDEVGSSCEVGNCGTCRVGVREGKVEHRGRGLGEEEKGEAMLACVSRAVGCITIEI
ncbi:hypothetical protein VTJ49DRAFT_3291 [Mycothermus thermophilus]|uniref:Uncharacterized protein n=1 Tax=Humicola insolens TaxID=85995 RepID=A0ABR3V8J9_HUMIN